MALQVAHAIVPVVVMVPPVIGDDVATLVTVPVPAGRSAVTRDRKLGCAAPPDVGPAHTVFALCVVLLIASVPLVVIGEPETENSAGTVWPTLVTVPVPAGRSAATSDLKVGVAAPPLVGPAKTVFALSVVKVTAKVPLVVTGEPATLKMLGMVSPTLLTVPPPEAVTVQMPLLQVHVLPAPQLTV